MFPLTCVLRIPACLRRTPAHKFGLECAGDCLHINAMTGTDRFRFSRSHAAGALVVVLCALGAAVLGISRFGSADTGPGECRLSQPLADKLQPLAKGEVAALVPSSVAKQPPEIMFQGPEG